MALSIARPMGSSTSPTTDASYADLLIATSRQPVIVGWPDAYGTTAAAALQSSAEAANRLRRGNFYAGSGLTVYMRFLWRQPFQLRSTPDNFGVTRQNRTRRIQH